MLIGTGRAARGVPTLPRKKNLFFSKKGLTSRFFLSYWGKIKINPNERKKMTFVQNLKLKIRLQNSIAKSKAALEEIKADIEAQKAEIARLKKILSDM